MSSARNTGLAAATGEIVAYLDDDAYPDSHWLKYLAATFLSTSHTGVGGPNLVPLDDPAVAQCVGNAPGGPTHVLLTDSEAEHIPGCNMAFRKSGLSAIGGFDAQFRRAGDDVDVCWRIQNMGWTIGFSPAALVWHHRRASIGAYLKQQKSYGQAEALLQRKWPEKFNIAGQMEWHGRLYGAGLLHGLGLSHRIYHGARGSAPFQSLRSPVPSSLSYLPAMPEWLVVTLFLGGLSALGWLWPRLLWCVPLFALAVGVSVYQAAVSAGEATRFGSLGSSRAGLAGLRCLTFLFYLLQPAARLWGRVSYGLLPGKPRVPRVLAWPVRKKLSYWSEEWQDTGAETEKIGIRYLRTGSHARARRQLRSVGLRGADGIARGGPAAVNRRRAR